MISLGARPSRPHFSNEPTSWAVRRAYRLFPLLAALILVPIVGHGCHGDGVDHEPSVHREAASGESSDNGEP